MVDGKKTANFVAFRPQPPSAKSDSKDGRGNDQSDASPKAEPDSHALHEHVSEKLAHFREMKAKADAGQTVRLKRGTPEELRAQLFGED